MNDISNATSTCPKYYCTHTIKLCQKSLWRNMALMNLKLKNKIFLLRVQPKFFTLTLLTLEVA